MTSRFLPPLLLVVGLLLLAGSWVLPEMAGRGEWTERDAKAFSDASANVHALTYQVAEAEQRRSLQNSTSAGGGRGAGDSRGATLDYLPTKDDLAAAEERYHALRARLDEARSRGQTTAAIMRWVGMALIVLGVVGYTASRTPAA